MIFVASCKCLSGLFFRAATYGGYLLQLEQLPEEQLPQEELAVLLKVPPDEKAKVDILRLIFLLLHFGQSILSEELKTSLSNSCLHCPQAYS